MGKNLSVRVDKDFRHMDSEKLHKIQMWKLRVYSVNVHVQIGLDCALGLECSISNDSKGESSIRGKGKALSAFYEA
jgi:hypothetical protein